MRGIRVVASMSFLGLLSAIGCAGSDSAPGSPAGVAGDDDDDDSASERMGDPAADGESPAANAGDKYEAVGTNPWTMTAHDPLSTFAADVDTASYDIFRRDISAGVLPQPDSVRLEEYVNYFSYDYPAPAHDETVPFDISLAAAPSLTERDTVLLRVGIKGKAAPPEGEKKPANLVFLIDTSGSMTGEDRLPLVQYTLTEALGVLEPADRVAIVTYAGSTEVRLESTPVSEESTIAAVIDDLESGGSTAGAAGLTLAYEQATEGYIEGGINHVILCTDGDFNVGPSSNQELLDLIKTKRQTGVTLAVLGFGVGNLNDSMMEAVSNAGNGVYGVIADQDSAARYVHDRLLSTLTFIAKDVKLQVELNPEHALAYRLLGYENRALADDEFRDDTVDAGEIGAGHTVTALYELVMRGGDVPVVDGAPAIVDGQAFAGALEVAAEDLALVKVRYKDVDATEDDAAREVSESLPTSEVGDSFAEVDADFGWAAAVASFAEILKGSPYADGSRLEEIEGTIKRPVYDEDVDRQEFEALFLNARGLLEGVE